MENASKALLIAAGVLVGLILISMILFTHNQISNYYETKEQNKEIEQIDAFNKQYIAYNRDNVRGSDLLSLVNKIIDFNSPKIDFANDIPITISIRIENDEDKDNAPNIYYGGNQPSGKKLLFNIKQEYTHLNIEEKLNDALEIENNYPNGKAKKLADNLFTLMREDNPGEDKAEKARKDLFEQLKLEYSQSNLTTYREDILRYYQYMQFKRAHFNCTGLTYTGQGRVLGFTFVFNGKIE